MGKVCRLKVELDVILSVCLMKQAQDKKLTDSVSIIVNSCDDERYQLFEQRFLRRLFFLNAEVIRIADAVSMAEGYNRGAARAKGTWLFFCHDDIAILDNEIADILSYAMRNSDVFGPCGTCKLVSGNWYDAGQPYICGAVVAPDYNRKNAYQLELFGKSRKKLCHNAQALDGLFIACKRDVFDAIQGFDEKHLRGFHTYDIDFTFRTYLAGFNCVVVNNLLLLHDSNVSEFTQEKLIDWECEQKRFIERFGQYLHVVRGVRRHDVISLNNPEDGVSVRQKACKLSLENLINLFKKQSINPPSNVIWMRFVYLVGSFPIFREITYIILRFVRR